MTCDDTLCGPPASALSTLVSLFPFILTFAGAFLVATTKLFPYLSTTFSQQQQSSRSTESIDDGEDHLLPASAPATLRQAHLYQAEKNKRPRTLAARAAFGVTVGLAVVLGELILGEILEMVDPGARAAATRVTVGGLVVMLVVVVPALEAGGVVDGLGLGGWRSGVGGGKGKGKRRFAWGLQIVVFAAWLGVFWAVGGMVPSAESSLEGYKDGAVGGAVDNTAATLAHGAPARVSRERTGGTSVDGGIFTAFADGGFSRACLERIGVIGISLMALLSGFASVSSPWHTFIDNRAYKRRPVTDADIARKQAGLDATSEMLITKKHRLRSLQRKVAAASDAAAASGSTGFVGKMIGSLKGIGGGGGDAAEIKALQVEISGLEAMESTLSSSLSVLRNRQAAHARDGTALGRILSVPGYIFSLYCIYRILATSLTTLRRAYQPQSSTFSSSDPINRFLGLLARHWDPKLDQTAWARTISFLLSGVILAASANSVLQTLHLFARWAPSLVLRQARADLALIVGQVAATYVISSALLLRSNLPREVGRSVGDAILESALEPAFVDRWFEGWFLLASAATAAGIWVGRQIGGGGIGGWDDWEDFGAEEMGQKRS